MNLRYLAILLLCSPLMLHALSLQDKLQQTNIEYNKMDKQLAEVANKILIEKEAQHKVDSKIKNLEVSLSTNQMRYQSLSSQLASLDSKINTMNVIIDKKQEQFIKLSAKNFSISLALEKIKQPTKDSVILQEIYKVYEVENKKEISKLKQEIFALQSSQSKLLSQQSGIKIAMDNYNQQKNEYEFQKSTKNKIITNLSKDSKIYQKKFDELSANRRKIQATLENLNIVQKSTPRVQKSTLSTTTTDVREVESLNESKSIGLYSGGKTISPLDDSTVIKKFGTYIDPIYKFKIFNKSITLKAPYDGAKVKVVLEGKVVFAEDSGGMLGKVVIVSHENNIHTIYAKLSRLAPDIQVGRRLSRGTIIGKVNSALMFEVTKNKKHIDPLSIIQLQ